MTEMHYNLPYLKKISCRTLTNDVYGINLVAANSKNDCVVVIIHIVVYYSSD